MPHSFQSIKPIMDWSTDRNNAKIHYSEISVATPTYILASMYEGPYDERTVDMLSRVINKRERFARI